jgi:soluble lytic murein transglycosylase-like protein
LTSVNPAICGIDQGAARPVGRAVRGVGWFEPAEGATMMGDRRIEREGRNDPRVGRESLHDLVRKPMVQALLAVAVLAQAVGMQARAGGDEPIVATAAELEAAHVVPDSALQAAWLERAVAREAERLGAEYRTKGYNVSPALAAQITKAAAEFEIEPQVAFGLVRAESSFRTQATSRVGAVGLTQLMPRTAAWMEPGVTRAQLRDPETNLRIGFMYLRYLLDKYDGDEKLALIAYNRGPGTVDNALRRGRNPDNGYADFVYGNPDHGHRLFTRSR